MKLLTLKQLKEMPEGIFAKGEYIDSPEGCNVANTGKKTRWVAVRGSIHDWAIYSQNPYYEEIWDWVLIKEQGDKIYSEVNIKKLVPCDDEAFEMYRY